MLKRLIDSELEAMRILIVDDSPLLRGIIIRLLRQEIPNLFCREASNSAEAIDAASAMLPDIILLDLNLPDASGTQTAHLIREKLPDVRIIVISANQSEVLSIVAKNAAADGALDKSRIGIDLVPMLKRLCAQ